MKTMQMRTQHKLDLQELIQLCSTRLNHLFSSYLLNISSLELKTAMQYTLLNNGKRLRPLLIYATGLTFGATLDNLDLPAGAVELIHTYSLIHDDLPCMDNADLRRGKLTCHKKFNEGIAVLTGDALHTLAMQIISAHPATLKAEKRIKMMRQLSIACGPFGMAAGQALDITVMNGSDLSIDLLENIYRLKTGCLFSACIELGWLCSNDDDEKNHQALLHFGDCVGLAFQIQDDILDIESSSAEMGKTQGIDQINNKATFPKLLGLAAAKEKVSALYDEALETINYLGSQADLLRELTTMMLGRKH